MTRGEATVHFGRVDTRPYYLVMMSAAVLGGLGLALNAALLVVFIPLIVFAIAAVANRMMLFIVMTAVSSVAVYLGGVPIDLLAFPILTLSWAIHFKNRISVRNARHLYFMAVLNAIWVIIVLVIHGMDFDAKYAWFVGVRLISFYAAFWMVLDLTGGVSAEWIRRLIFIILAISTIPTLYALFEAMVMGKGHVSSILEPHHSHLGNYGVAAVMVAGWGIVLASSGFGKLLSWGAFLCGCLAVIFSETRSDMLGLAAGFIAFGVARNTRTLLVTLVCLVSFSQVGFVRDILEREKAMTLQEGALTGRPESGVETSIDVSSAERVMIWLGVVEYLQHANFQQLAIGVGPGNFGPAMLPYMTIHALYINRPGVTMNGAHNNILHVTSELGVVGFLLSLVFLVGCAYQLFRMRKNPEPRIASLAAITFAALIGLFASSFTQETFYSQPSMGNFYGFLLLLLAIFYGYANRIAPAARG